MHRSRLPAVAAAPIDTPCWTGGYRSGRCTCRLMRAHRCGRRRASRDAPGIARTSSQGRSADVFETLGVRGSRLGPAGSRVASKKRAAGSGFARAITRAMSPFLAPARQRSRRATTFNSWARSPPHPARVSAPVSSVSDPTMATRMPAPLRFLRARSPGASGGGAGDDWALDDSHHTYSPTQTRCTRHDRTATATSVKSRSALALGHPAAEAAPALRRRRDSTMPWLRDVLAGASRALPFHRRAAFELLAGPALMARRKAPICGRGPRWRRLDPIDAAPIVHTTLETLVRVRCALPRIRRAAGSRRAAGYSELARPCCFLPDAAPTSTRPCVERAAFPVHRCGRSR